MTWSISVRTISSSLLVMMELPSANPKREWSVKMALTDMVRAWRMASWQRALNAWRGGTSLVWTFEVGVERISQAVCHTIQGDTGRVLSTRGMVLGILTGRQVQRTPPGPLAGSGAHVHWNAVNTSSGFEQCSLHHRRRGALYTDPA